MMSLVGAFSKARKRARTAKMQGDDRYLGDNPSDQPANLFLGRSWQFSIFKMAA